MTTKIYRDSYVMLKELLASGRSARFVSDELMEELLLALEANIVPQAALQLYEKQRAAMARYELALMGLFDDFEAATVGDLAEQGDPDEQGDPAERKRRARDRIGALAYFMVMASWDWIHYGYAMGKLSVWYSQTDELLCSWEWQRNRLFVYRELVPDLTREIDRAIEEGGDIGEVLERFRWRVRMYAGSMWRVMQKGTVHRPPPEERVKAKSWWEPATKWWVWPLLLPLAWPLLWEPPEEWDVPEGYAEEESREAVAQKEVYWHGLADERSCVGETGCLDKIGKVWPVARLEIQGWWPGEMDCMTNCRCTVFEVGDDGGIVEEGYGLPWD